MSKPTIPMDGGCLCGQVRFRISAPPIMTFACHCRGCQHLTGSAFSLSIAAPTAAFQITAGQPVIGALHGPSHYWYCPHCMNWLYTEPDGMDWFVNVRATLLDDPYWFSPFVETKTSEKLPWVTIPARYSYPEWPPNDVFEGIAKDYAAQFG